MPQMSQVLKERAIGMLTAGMSTRAVAKECNVNFSTISCLPCFRESVSASNLPRVWRRVGEQFAHVNVVNKLPHVGRGVIVWLGISYGKLTQLHFTDGNLNAQRNRDKILRHIVVPFIRRYHVST